MATSTAKEIRQMAKDNRFLFLSTPLNRYPTFCKEFINKLKEKENEMVKESYKKCGNKKCQYHSKELEIDFSNTNCTEWADIKKCGHSFVEKKERLVPENSYTFRGDINVDHVINDCVKDQKNCFVVIGKKEAVLGISRQLPVKDKVKLTNQLKGSYEDDVVKSFYIIDFELKDVSFVVSELPKISKLIKKQIMKNTKILKKQMKKDWDNQLPETKVMVY